MRWRSARRPVLQRRRGADGRRLGGGADGDVAAGREKQLFAERLSAGQRKCAFCAQTFVSSDWTEGEATADETTCWQKDEYVAVEGT